jgi:hypothetical protein
MTAELQCIERPLMWGRMKSCGPISTTILPPPRVSAQSGGGLQVGLRRRIFPEQGENVAAQDV